MDFSSISTGYRYDLCFVFPVYCIMLYFDKSDLLFISMVCHWV